MTPMYGDKFARLSKAVAAAERSYALAQLQASARGTATPERHKCFVSYHGADIDGVTAFVETYNDVFIPRVVGVSDSDHFRDPISSQDEEYIKQQIGAKYLSDSTVTIVYVGKCTWSRKYVDWEVSSSLRNDRVNKRNGLMGITPVDRSTNALPERLQDNLTNDGSGYARYYYYPTSASDLRSWIQDAFDARTSRSTAVANSRKLRRHNAPCA